MGRSLDVIQWPKQKLADRFEELEDLLEFTQHPPRREELSHELMLIAFELVERKKDDGSTLHS